MTQAHICITLYTHTHTYMHFCGPVLCLSTHCKRHQSTRREMLLSTSCWGRQWCLYERRCMWIMCDYVANGPKLSNQYKQLTHETVKPVLYPVAKHCMVYKIAKHKWDRSKGRMSGSGEKEWATFSRRLYILAMLNMVWCFFLLHEWAYKNGHD